MKGQTDSGSLLEHDFFPDASQTICPLCLTDVYHSFHHHHPLIIIIYQMNVFSPSDEGELPVLCCKTGKITIKLNKLNQY